MEICWFGFLSKNHSWSIVSQNIIRQLIKRGHKVDLFSTNGIELFPNDLKLNLKGFIDDNKNLSEKEFYSILNSSLKSIYDAQFSYTALKNFDKYFIRGNKNRFGIWNYETTILPNNFAKNYKYVDKLLPSSNFSKKIFKDNGIPEANQVVIPHGINIDKFKYNNKFNLKTNKKIKILSNIAQPHIRKNIPGLLKMWGEAFNKEDDVCLVLKISKKIKGASFEVSFDSLLKDFKLKYKNHADIEVIDYFIENIESLYNSCDIVITMAHAECFWMPGLEGFAANKVVISPRYGGQLDYMNDNNSVLIDGKIIRADMKMQYWESSPYAAAFEPNLLDAVNKIKDVVKNYNDYLNKFSPNMNHIVENYTWEKVTDKIECLFK